MKAIYKLVYRLEGVIDIQSYTEEEAEMILLNMPLSVLKEALDGDSLEVIDAWFPNDLIVPP